MKEYSLPAPPERSEETQTFEEYLRLDRLSVADVSSLLLPEWSEEENEDL